MNTLCIKVTAPGKVILHGEHAVVFGKTAVAISLGLRASMLLKTTSEPRISLNFTTVGIKESIRLDLVDEELSNCRRYTEDPEGLPHEEHLIKTENFVRGSFQGFDLLKNTQKNALVAFFYVLFGIFGGERLACGLDISLESELTVGAGTGSSASFAVCLAGGMLGLASEKRGGSAETLNFQDKMLISKWAYNCERITHGTPSGIDNTTATFGALVSFRKGEKPQLLNLKLDLRILLVNSRVSRETQVLARKAREVVERNREIGECVLGGIDHIAKNALKILQKLCSGDYEGGSDCLYAHLAELWNMNHCLLASLCVSHPALESIRASATSHGFACKLTGAGGGGYAIVLVPPNTRQSLLEGLTRELLSKGFQVVDTNLGGPGVTISTSS
ncbi:unnamed protein product [Leptosia nina]|uniref:Mevalonate kinase n=1 Tax=Leptosia nina TaxID=320188 RepID=A0AAV1JUE2_9NEOP